jgi:hypothetical protein
MEGKNLTQLLHSKTGLEEREHASFSQTCGRAGHGPYVKMTRNRTDGNVYRKYVYFVHKVEGPNGSIKTDWCYIKKSLAKELYGQLPNQAQETDCRRCPSFTSLQGRPFCKALNSFLAEQTFTQPCPIPRNERGVPPHRERSTR